MTNTDSMIETMEEDLKQIVADEMKARAVKLERASMRMRSLRNVDRNLAMARIYRTAAVFVAALSETETERPE